MELSDHDAEELLIAARIYVSMARKYGQDDPQWFDIEWGYALEKASEETVRGERELDVIKEFLLQDGTLIVQFEHAGEKLEVIETVEPGSGHWVSVYVVPEFSKFDEEDILA